MDLTTELTREQLNVLCFNLHLEDLLKHGGLSGKPTRFQVVIENPRMQVMKTEFHNSLFSLNYLV